MATSKSYAEQMREKAAANIDSMPQNYEGLPFLSIRTAQGARDMGMRLRVLKPSYLKEMPWLAVKCFSCQPDGMKFFTSPFAHAFGKTDPVWDYMQSNPNQNRFKRRDSYYCLVVDLDAPDKGVQIWNHGPQIWGAIQEEMINPDNNPVFWSLEDGHDIRVRKTGEGLSTEYSVRFAREQSAFKLSKELEQQVESCDLARLVRVETEETLRDLVDNNAYDKDEAAERRKERDEALGRPFPLFLSDGGGKKPQPEQKTAARSESPKPSKSSKKEPEGFSHGFSVGDEVEYRIEDESGTMGGDAVVAELARNEEGEELVIVQPVDGSEPLECFPEELKKLPPPAPAKQETGRSRTRKPAAKPQEENLELFDGATPEDAKPAGGAGGRASSRVASFHSSRKSGG